MGPALLGWEGAANRSLTDGRGPRRRDGDGDAPARTPRAQACREREASPRGEPEGDPRLQSWSGQWIFMAPRAWEMFLGQVVVGRGQRAPGGVGVLL